MKRIITVFIIILLLVSIGTAYTESIDLSSLSNEELLNLPQAISAEMISRGLVKSAQLGSGKYTVGKDIPAGSYIITNEYKYSMNIHVVNRSGKTAYNLALWKTGEETGKIELNEGDVLDINGNILLTVYTGVFWQSESLLKETPVVKTTETPKVTSKPTATPKPKATSKPSNSGYNYTSEEYAQLIIKGINGTLTPAEAELLERYYQYFK